ncbi:hypothetical protein [Mesorhizobium sp. M0643]|uniref:hypothetical protein n=1 Tax=Mesorhizobium sp. M0643 TaxID=2956978 RepID=UPI0033357116
MFSNPHDLETAQTPQWQALPSEARRALTKLMVRLTLDHVDDGGTPERQEALMMSDKIRPHHRAQGDPVCLPFLRP